MNYQEFFRDVRNILHVIVLQGGYIAPKVLTQLEQLRAAPIFDNERAALVLAKYETEIEDLLQDEDMTPYSAEIRELMCACLAELRGEIPPKPPAIRTDTTYQKITKIRASRTDRTKIPETT